MIKTHADHRGFLTVIEKTPFDIKRVYYIYGVAEGKTRGGHAHKETERYMVAVSGKFKVIMENKLGNKVDFIMNDPKNGIFIPKMTYLELSDFSENAICLVLASKEHDESDCIRSYEDFVNIPK